MNTEWKRKLSSRKFWAAIAGFAASLLVGIGMADSTATQVTALIMSVVSLIAYILGEGMVDAGHVGEDAPKDDGNQQ